MIRKKILLLYGVSLSLFLYSQASFFSVQQMETFMKTWPRAISLNKKWTNQVKSVVQSHQKNTRYKLPDYWNRGDSNAAALWQTQVKPPASVIPTYAETMDRRKAFAGMRLLSEIPNGLSGGSRVQSMRLFSGRAGFCQKRRHFSLEKSCCTTRIKRHGFHLNHCPPSAYELAAARRAGRTHFVGQYCAQYLGVGPGKICLVYKKAFCIFSSMIAKRVQVHLHHMEKRGWGTARVPQCQGLAVAEIKKVAWEGIIASPTFPNFRSRIHRAKVSKQMQSLSSQLPSHIKAITSSTPLRVLHPSQEGGWQVSVFPLEGQGPFMVWVTVPVYYKGLPVQDVSVFWGDGRYNQRHYRAVSHDSQSSYWRFSHHYPAPVLTNQTEQIRVMVHTPFGTLRTQLHVLNYWNEPDNVHIKGGGYADEPEFRTASPWVERMGGESVMRDNSH